MWRTSVRRCGPSSPGSGACAVEHTALNLRELLEANVGAEVIISESPTNSYEATIAAVPARSADELTATSPPNSGDRLAGERAVSFC